MPEVSRSEKAAYERQLIFGQDWPSNFSTMNTIVINDNADDWDFIVETDTSTQAFVVDGGLNAVRIGTTTAGNLADFRSTDITFNEGGSDTNFRLETDTNSNAVIVDAGLFGGVGQVSLGSAAQTTATAFTVIDNPATTAVANQPFAKLLIAGSAATTVPAGTSAVVAGLRVEEPNITATGTVTVGTTAYFPAAPTEGTNNYTIFSDAGLNRLDGDVVIGGGATAGATLDIADTVVTTGTSATLLVTGAAHTGMTADTEVNFVRFNLGQTVQWAVSTTLTTERAFRIDAPTLAFVTASTITDAATFYVNAAPTAGTNATITNAWTTWIDAGNSRFDGRVCMAKGADIASGTTLTFGSDGNFFDITGVTTINHITTAGWTIGSIIILQFDGSVIVTHNGATPPAGTVPILLSGAANFSATAGDTLTLVYEGTTGFREVARTVI